MSNKALEKLAGAKIHGDHAKMNYGDYLYRVLAHRGKYGGHWGDTAIAELKVLESTDLPSFPTSRDGTVQCPPQKASRVGETISYTESLSTPGDGGESKRGRFMKHLMGVFALDAPLKTPQLLHLIGTEDIAPSPDQPSAFMLVRCQCVPNWVEPKPGGKYTKGTFLPKWRWSAVDPTDEQLAEIERLRAEAKLPPLGDALEKLFSLG